MSLVAAGPVAAAGLGILDKVDSSEQFRNGDVGSNTVDDGDLVLSDTYTGPSHNLSENTSIDGLKVYFSGDSVSEGETVTVEIGSVDSSGNFSTVSNGSTTVNSSDLDNGVFDYTDVNVSDSATGDYAVRLSAGDDTTTVQRIELNSDDRNQYLGAAQGTSNQFLGVGVAGAVVGGVLLILVAVIGFMAFSDGKWRLTER